MHIQSLDNTSNSEIEDLLIELETTGGLVIKSSGSTGTPKEMFFNKAQLFRSAEITCEQFQLHKGDKILLCLPLSFVAGKMMVIRALHADLELLHVNPSSNPLAELNKSIQFCALTPMQVGKIIEHCPEKFNLIDSVIIGGGALPEHLIPELKKLNTKFYKTFGMAETLTHFAVTDFDSNEYQILKGFEVSQLGSGQLVVQGSHVGQLTTNDIVNLNGRKFTWIGRVDNVINTGGVKVQAEVIEKKLSELLKDHNYFIAAAPDETLGSAVTLYVEGEPKQLNFDNLELSKFEIPRSVKWVGKFKRTHTNKIDKIATSASI